MAVSSASASASASPSALSLSLIFASHTLASLYFLVRLVLQSPLLPIIPVRNHYRAFYLLSSLPFIFITFHEQFAFRIPIILSYLLASLHLARIPSTIPIQRPHLLFLSLSFLSFSFVLPPLLLVSCLSLLLAFRVSPAETTRLSRVHPALPPTPAAASIAELLLFTWMGPLVTLGKSRPLEDDDIAPLADVLKSERTGAGVFDRIWNEERQRTELERSQGVDAAQPSLWRALARAFGKQLLQGSLLKLLNDVCIFISPMILRRIILALQRKNDNVLQHWTDNGYALSSLLLVTYVCQSMFFNQYFHNNSLVQVKVRGALIHAVFAKSCRLSSLARASFTSGNIQNMMATDSRTVADLVLYINMLWSAMEQIIVALVLLIALLGWIPTAIGVLVIILSIPLESRLLALTKDLRETASSWTDDRVKAVNEAIQGIKVVKLYAWELSFIERILGKRAGELQLIRSALWVNAWNVALANSLPTLLSIATFAAYAVKAHRLDAAIVFPAIALFNILRPPLLIFPFTAVSCARAAASVSRLQRFLCAEELKSLRDGPHSVPIDTFEDLHADVVAEHAAFSWNPTPGVAARPSLANVSFNVPQGSFVCIVGPTGCGKSTLLASLLGEVPVLSGKVGIRPGRSVSFADQVPFIQNGTIRDNILFGRPFNLERYRRIVRVCSLVPDLRILPGGDMTEIGGRGINLSGGQRSRVSIARVAYAKADVALLDDPLSAVDAHVGRSLFEECIVKEMQGSTRIVTTNQIHFATSQSVDYVAVVRDGALVEFGPRADLLRDRSSAFAALVESAGELGGVAEEESTSDDLEGDDFAGDSASSTSDPSGLLIDGIILPETNDLKTVQDANEKTPLLKSDSTSVTTSAGRLVNKEEKSEGRVKVEHYIKYMNAAGGLRTFLLVVFLSVSAMICSMMVNVWLSIWSERSALDAKLPPAQGYAAMLSHLTVYILLGVASIAVITVTALVIAFASIRASVALHEDLLISVFGAPSSWFSANPVGRIVNRFNSDIDKVDSTLASTLNAFVKLALNLVGALFLILYATPGFILFIVPVGAMFLYIQEFYRKSSVDLRRLEALARSPLYSHFSEILDGVVTVRAFNEVPQQTRVNYEFADSLNRITYVSAAANRWLAVRLEGLGTILIFTSACLAIASSGTVSPSLTGLVLSYAMQLLSTMTWSVRQFTETESQMSAIERISEFSTAPPFPQEEEGGLDETLKRRSANGATEAKLSREFTSEARSEMFGTRSQRGQRWPRRGRIEFRNITMRYRADLDPALREVSLAIAPGERIGIVGRTGAGKSSLLSALFRLNKLESGTIVIDGTDISSMSLFDLRSALSVIPQEPYCFSGTIRSNLDMFGEYDDASVQEALNACGLEETMGQSISLDYEVQENGQNLSVGQRQLLCLGRALLRNSQILILDEATSSVSNDTDEKIQATLRNEMGHCTVLTVAHRLHTVMTSDRIVVMDHGRIAEVGRPSALLETDSMLSDLVNETGPSTATYLRHLANGAPRGDYKTVRRALSKTVSGRLPMLPESPKCAGECTEMHKRTHAAFRELRDAITDVDSPDWGLDLMQGRGRVDRTQFKNFLKAMIGSLHTLSSAHLDSQSPMPTLNGGHYGSMGHQTPSPQVTIDMHGNAGSVRTSPRRSDGSVQ